MELKIFAKKNELPNAFEKGPQKWSLLNLIKKDDIISANFCNKKRMLQRSVKLSLLFFAFYKQLFLLQFLRKIIFRQEMFLILHFVHLEKWVRTIIQRGIVSKGQFFQKDLFLILFSLYRSLQIKRFKAIYNIFKGDILFQEPPET